MPEPTETPSAPLSFKKVASRLTDLRDKNCDLCPLHEETERVCVIGNPPTRSVPFAESTTVRLTVVGEAPGANEESSGLLFSGAAGELLWEELAKYDLAREHFLVTNVAKCRPVDNATPTPGQIRTCVARYLGKEMEIATPSFGLALGNSALRGLLRKSGITKHNATTFEAYGVTWVACLHPAAVLRNPKYRPDFQTAVQLFSRLVRGEDGSPVTNAVCVNDKDTLRSLVADLKAAKKASIDIEAYSEHERGGLAWWDSTFKLAAINITTLPGKAYVLPLHHPESRWSDPDALLLKLKPYLEAVPYWIMQNGKYDEKALQGCGIKIRQSFDTMGAAYAIDENNRKDLGFLSTVYLSADEYKGLLHKDVVSTPLNDLVEYGARDADYTYRLHSILDRRLSDEPLNKRLFEKLLMPVTNVLTDVELTGLPLHRRKFEYRREQCEKNVAAALVRLEEYAGRPINPRSPKQLADLLYLELDFPVEITTKTGNPSTAESALIRLRDIDDTGVVDAIFDFRLWDGYRSRYFENWAVRMDSRGRLHPTFKPFHTVTGRLSATDPNVQQIPRNTFIRGIVGGRKGWRVVEADYSQVELRIVAHYSQDKAMLRAYNTGRDIHTETAMAVTGLPESGITAEIRKKAKAVNFGFVYGMGWRKFRQYSKDNYGIEVSDAEAQEARRAFFDLFRKLPSWHERQRRAARRRQWVVSSIGRKRHLWDIDSTNQDIRAEAERQAINSPVQSLASDMTLMSMLLLAGDLDPTEARIIATVHDSILLEVREDRLDYWAPRIKRTMEERMQEFMYEAFEAELTVPIVADIKVGRFWSEDATELNL